MGCWNETCGVSNLPLTCGEDIVVVPLAAFLLPDMLPRARVSYVDKYFKPLCLPIKGTYDDYGGLDNSEVDAQIVSHLNKLDIRIRDGEGAERTIVFPEAGEGFDTVFSAYMHDVSNCYLKSVTQGRFVLDYMVIRRDIFDMLVTKMGRRVPYDRGKTLRVLFEETLNDKAIYAYQKERKKDPYAAMCAGLGSDSASKTVLRDVMQFDCPKLAGLAVEYFEGGYFAFKDKFVELFLFSYALQALRKGWLCNTSGAGSSDYELQMHKELSEMILSIIEEKRVLWRKENTDELCLESDVYFG